MQDMENLKYSYTSPPLHAFLAQTRRVSPLTFTLTIQADTTNRYSHGFKIVSRNEIWPLRRDEYHLGLWRRQFRQTFYLKWIWKQEAHLKHWKLRIRLIVSSQKTVTWWVDAFAHVPSAEKKGAGESVLGNDAVKCQDTTASMTDEWNMSMDHQWNDTDGKVEVRGQNPFPVSHCAK
jgi:hypothetical protein